MTKARTIKGTISATMGINNVKLERPVIKRRLKSPNLNITGKLTTNNTTSKTTISVVPMANKLVPTNSPVSGQSNAEPSVMKSPIKT